MARRIGFGDERRDERAQRLIQEDQAGWAAYLDEDEEILWTGQPEPGIGFQPSDFFKSLFGLFFFGFAIFWTFMASSIGNGTGIIGYIFPLFGIPFILVGGYLLFGRFFWRAYARKHTRYALSSKRALIATSAVGRKMKSYPITGRSGIELALGPPDTVNFATRFVRTKHGGHEVPIGFERISNGQEVYRLLRQIKAGTA